MSDNFYEHEKQLSQQGAVDPANYIQPGQELEQNRTPEDVFTVEPKVKKKRHISLEIAIWTWISVVIGYLLIAIFATGWAGLALMLYGFFGAVIAFAVAFITAIVELIRKRSWLPSISAMLLSSPVVFVGLNVFGFGL